MKFKHFNLQFGTQILRSFSQESRVRVMYLLFCENELNISDIEHILDFTQTKTPRHVSYLKNAGLLNVRKQDQWIFYQIKDEVMGMVDQMFKFLNRDQQLLKDLEILETLLSNRELAINKINKRF